MVLIRRELSLTIRAGSGLWPYRIGRSRFLLLRLAIDRWLLGTTLNREGLLGAHACLVPLALDMHADSPDEAKEFPSHRDDDFLVRHAPFSQPSISTMEPVLSLPGDLFHRLLDAFLAGSQCSVDPRTMPVGPCRFDENASKVAIARLGDPAPMGFASARMLAWDRAAVAH
jgi:hypothetical protein